MNGRVRHIFRFVVDNRQSGTSRTPTPPCPSSPVFVKMVLTWPVKTQQATALCPKLFKRHVLKLIRETVPYSRLCSSSSSLTTCPGAPAQSGLGRLPRVKNNSQLVPHARSDKDASCQQVDDCRVVLVDACCQSLPVYCTYQTPTLQPLPPILVSSLISNPQSFPVCRRPFSAMFQ